MRYSFVSVAVVVGHVYADNMSQYLLTTISDGQPQAPMPMSTPYTSNAMGAMTGPCSEEATAPIAATTPASTIPVYTPASYSTVAPVASSSAASAAQPPVYASSSATPSPAAPTSNLATGAVGSSSVVTPVVTPAITPAVTPSSSAPSGLLTVISDNQPQAPSPVPSPQSPSPSGVATGAIGTSSTAANSPAATPVYTPVTTPASSGIATGAVGGSATTSGPAIQTANAGVKNLAGSAMGAGAALVVAGILMA